MPTLGPNPRREWAVPICSGPPLQPTFNVVSPVIHSSPPGDTSIESEAESTDLSMPVSLRVSLAFN